jgi:hypothetical protein
MPASLQQESAKRRRNAANGDQRAANGLER